MKYAEKIMIMVMLIVMVTTLFYPAVNGMPVNPTSASNKNATGSLNIYKYNPVTRLGSIPILYNVSRYPEDPVSEKPVFISMKSPYLGQMYIYSNVSINITTNGVLLGVRHYYYNTSIEIPTIYLLGGYIGAIPALPAFNYTTTFGNTYNVTTYNVTSFVSYYMTYGNITYSHTYYYNVSTSTTTNYSLIYAFTPSLLSSNFSNLTDTYYGLSNPGFVSYQNTPNEIYITTLSSSSIESNNVSLQYNVSGSGWTNVTVNNASTTAILSNYTHGYQPILSMLNNISNYLKDLGILNNTFDYSPLSFFVGTIPGVGLGNYVTYRGLVTTNTNKSVSPIGMYFITNSSGKKVFFVDPHPFLWLLSMNINNLTNLLFSFLLPDTLTQSISSINNISILIENSQFEYLYKLTQYNIYISYPSDGIPKEVSQFVPNAIVLDNLFLGIQTSLTNLFNWNLGNLYYENNSSSSSVESYILNYIQNHNIGLIATSGTLSDLQYWQDPGQQTDISPVQDVGTNISDANIFNTNVISTALGFPLLPVYEYLKNITAQFLSVSGQPDIASLIGSIPLLIPEMPWNGSLSIVNSTIFDNIPKNLSINYSNIYNGLKINATSTIGWQIALPIEFTNILFNAIKNILANGVSRFEKLLFSFISNNISQTNLTNYLNTSLVGYLKTLYLNITHSNVLNNNTLSIYLNNSLFLNISNIISELSPKIFAMSPNFEAGIIGYDKNFVKNGYRSVYVSYDMFNENTSIMQNMFNDIFNWSINWSYKPLFNYSGLLVSPILANEFNSTLEGQTIIYSKTTVIPANNFINISFPLNSSGTYTLHYISPDSYLRLDVGNMVYNLSSGVGTFNISSSSSTTHSAKIYALNPHLLFSPLMIIVTKSTFMSVTFTENGLPAGTTWYVNITGGASYSSTTSTITFSELNGSYSYTVATGNKEYAPTPASGSFTVNGVNVNQAVTFTLFTYTVTFTESGLPSGTIWYVNITGGASHSSTTSTITFSEPNGTYTYTVATGDKEYAPSPATGSFTVNGANVNQAVTFTLFTYGVTFTESGLPANTIWYVNVTNSTGITTSYQGSGTTITFSEPNLVRILYSPSLYYTNTSHSVH